MGNKNKGNHRLPYGLCLKYGIEIQEKWTPTDCWKALEKYLGKTMYEIYMSLENKEMDELSKMQIFGKSEAHPQEVTSLVELKISTVRRQLEKYGCARTTVNTGQFVYDVIIKDGEHNYDYTIIRKEKLKDGHN